VVAEGSGLSEAPVGPLMLRPGLQIDGLPEPGGAASHRHRPTFQRGR